MTKPLPSITCPHCGQVIGLKTSPIPRSRRYAWEQLDWSRSTVQLARELGVSPSAVSQQRGKYAPATLGHRRDTSAIDWAAIDWRKGTMSLAAELSVSPGAVTARRKKHAPHTLRPHPNRTK